MVIQDLNKPFPVLLPVAYNDAVQEMMTEANDLAAAIGDPSVSSSLAILAETLNTVGSLTNATSSAIATITGPLNSAQSAVSSSISSTTAETF